MGKDDATGTVTESAESTRAQDSVFTVHINLEDDKHLPSLLSKLSIFSGTAEPPQETRPPAHRTDALRLKLGHIYRVYPISAKVEDAPDLRRKG